MSEWKTYKLCEVADLSTGFPFDGRKYAKEGQRVVRGDNITIGELRWDTDKDKRWNEPFLRAEEFSLREGDIVIGMDGSRVGRNRAQIKIGDLPLFLAQRVACVRHNAKSLQKFLYYQIFSKRFEIYVKSVHTGTSIPHISLKQIGDFSFHVPDLITQRKIADILGALDDKIELNRRINANLEEQAQALFKSWFVDFEPFKDGPFVDSELGKIPQGWKVKKVGELCDSISVTHSCKEGNLIFLNTGDIEEGCVLTHSYMNVKDMPGQAKKSIQENDILYSEIRPVNRHFAFINFPAQEYIVSTKLMVIRAFNGFLSKRLYQFLTSNDVIKELQCEAESRSGTFPQIRFENIKNLKILMGTEDVEKQYREFIESIYEMVFQNNTEIETLSALRDVLLPKLMSGEIKVE